MTTAIGPQTAEPLREQLHVLFGKVGSFYPLRGNFRLTRALQETFTSKLKAKLRQAKNWIFR